jgi:DNA-binding NarL/FixJ family response regulator
MKRIALIEDDQLLLKRLTFFLNNQDEIECVLCASSLGVFFEKLTREKQPDLLLMDVELSKDMNTIAHISKVKALIPKSKILIFTGHNHPDYIMQALQSGADGFYLKGSGLSKLLEAIETTLSGGVYLSPQAVPNMMPYLRKQDTFNATPPPSTHQPDNTTTDEASYFLSQREKQVARRLIQGLSYKEIAQDINVSVNTVRHYVKVLYKKFEVSNKIQLSHKIKALI